MVCVCVYIYIYCMEVRKTQDNKFHDRYGLFYPKLKYEIVLFCDM